jgi:hypothetical protein
MITNMLVAIRGRGHIFESYCSYWHRENRHFFHTVILV